jgi:hypothetical protein
MKKTWLALLGLLLLVAPAAVQAQYAYSTNADGSIYAYTTNADGSANIAGYSGPPWDVTIPTNINGLTVTSIGNGVTSVFSASLTSVTIPDSVTSIGEYAFYDCTNLTQATLGDGLTSIGAYAFADCTSLTSVAIPASVTSIGDWAFAVCYDVTNATIANGLTSIGDNVFYDCNSLTNVAIPASVTSIGSGAFADCTSLTAITVDTNNPAYSSTNGMLFDITQSMLLQSPGTMGGSYTIPGSVTSLGNYAFAGCASLTNVTISASVTNIGDDTFLECGLISGTIPASVTSIGDDVFYDCASLTSVTIPSSVTSIGDYAFTYTGLTNVTIPKSVTSLGTDAFFGCFNLTNVTIPGSVTSLGDYAFYYCINLASVCFTGNPPPSVGLSLFEFDNNPTVYYLPGTIGWSNTFAYSPSVPAVLWNPVIQTGDGSFGISNHQFGFNITGTTNIPVVVEASTNLASRVWTPLQTVTLSNGLFYFSDPQSTNYHSRFYGLGLP